MKIRCIQLLNENTGLPKDNDPWLTVGKTYSVLSIFFSWKGILKFRLIGDDGKTPALHDARQFEPITSKLPKTWGIDFQPNNYFEIAPRTWLEQGFWERFFDGDKEAIEIFETEKAIAFDD